MIWDCASQLIAWFTIFFVVRPLSKLKEYFDIYQKIGGYPAVVTHYVEHHDIRKCEEMIGRLMDIFTGSPENLFRFLLPY